MSEKNDDMKARMLAALEAKKNKPGAPGTQTHAETGSKIRGGQRSGELHSAAQGRSVRLWLCWLSVRSIIN